MLLKYAYKTGSIKRVHVPKINMQPVKYAPFEFGNIYSNLLSAVSIFS